MTFLQATQKLMEEGVTLADVADALGVTHASVRRFRLDAESASYRSPPADWKRELSQLARARGARLTTLAGKIER